MLRIDPVEGLDQHGSTEGCGSCHDQTDVLERSPDGIEAIRAIASLAENPENHRFLQALFRHALLRVARENDVSEPGNVSLVEILHSSGEFYSS